MRVGVIRVLRNHLLKEFGRIVVLRLLQVNEAEVVHCIGIARRNRQLGVQLGAGIAPLPGVNIGQSDVVVGFGKEGSDARA